MKHNGGDSLYEIAKESVFADRYFMSPYCCNGNLLEWKGIVSREIKKRYNKLKKGANEKNI
jgi:hypothetical protein